MSKIQDIQNYINQCDGIMANADYEEAKELQEEIIGVYSKDISNITTNLDNYAAYATFIGSPPRKVDYLGDIKRLRAKLINYKNDLEDIETHRKEDLEMSRLKQSGLHITNTNTNDNVASANSSSSVDITLIFKQAIESLNSLPETLLSQQEKEDLEDKLDAIEMALQRKDKAKILPKIYNAFKFIAEKGIEVGLAVLPYLAEASKYASAMFV